MNGWGSDAGLNERILLISKDSNFVKSGFPVNVDFLLERGLSNGVKGFEVESRDFFSKVALKSVSKPKEEGGKVGSNSVSCGFTPKGEAGIVGSNSSESNGFPLNGEEGIAERGPADNGATPKEAESKDSVFKAGKPKEEPEIAERG